MHWVGYDDTKVEAYHYVAHSSKETDGFRGSKYIQSYSYPAFKELVKDCSRHKYAVFGTPCQIYAIRRFLEKKEDCLILASSSICFAMGVRRSICGENIRMKLKGK